MTLRPETEKFLRELESFSLRPLRQRSELGNLLECARAQKRMDRLEEAAFHAKFVSKSAGIMERIGPDGDGYAKLESEMRTSVGTAVEAIRAILKNLPEEDRRWWESDFFALDRTSFSKLLQLLNDLSWLKNWLLDGRELP